MQYFIDLLFYHRKLKCLVAVELKAGKFKPEYAGKMNYYLNLLNDFVREPDENSSQCKLDEIERFNKLMVGREIKMGEMKQASDLEVRELLQ